VTAEIHLSTLAVLGCERQLPGVWRRKQAGLPRVHPWLLVRALYIYVHQRRKDVVFVWEVVLCLETYVVCWGEVVQCMWEDGPTRAELCVGRLLRQQACCFSWSSGKSEVLASAHCSMLVVYASRVKVISSSDRTVVIDELAEAEVETVVVGIGDGQVEGIPLAAVGEIVGLLSGVEADVEGIERAEEVVVRVCTSFANDHNRIVEGNLPTWCSWLRSESGTELLEDVLLELCSCSLHVGHAGCLRLCGRVRLYRHRESPLWVLRCLDEPAAQVGAAVEAERSAVLDYIVDTAVGRGVLGRELADVWHKATCDLRHLFGNQYCRPRPEICPVNY